MSRFLPFNLVSAGVLTIGLLGCRTAPPAAHVQNPPKAADLSEIAAHLEATDSIETQATKLAAESDESDEKQAQVMLQACNEEHFAPYENLSAAEQKQVANQVASDLEGGPDSKADVLSNRSLLHLAAQKDFESMTRSKRLEAIGDWIRKNDSEDVDSRSPEQFRVYLTQVDIGLQDMLTEKDFDRKDPNRL